MCRRRVDIFVFGTYSGQGGSRIIVLHLQLPDVTDTERTLLVDVRLSNRHDKGICRDVHDDQGEDP